MMIAATLVASLILIIISISMIGFGLLTNNHNPLLYFAASGVGFSAAVCGIFNLFRGNEP